LSDDNSAGPDKNPKPLTSFGSQWMAKGPVSPLGAQLIRGEIDKEEYDRLRATKSLWWRIWYEESEAIFWTIAYIALMLSFLLPN